MTEQTPEQIAEKISDDLVERYGMDLGRLTRAIAAALTAERKRARPLIDGVMMVAEKLGPPHKDNACSCKHCWAHQEIAKLAAAESARGGGGGA